MEFLMFEGMQYIIRRPEGYREGEKYPVLLFLHGAGTRGSDIRVLENNPFFKLTAQHADLPFVTVAPLCHSETWFDLFETLKRLVTSIQTADFADPDRIYLIGASMGGYGTWQLAMCMPEAFAAIVPICGGGMYWDAGRLKKIPVWAFHGDSDPTVFPEESIKMVNAVNKRGGCAKLTVYPDTKHDAWTATYQNREVFEWLLNHRRHTEESKNENSYANAKKFG